MTSEVTSEDDIPTEWIPHLSKTGTTLTIDFMIGSEDILGKGFAAPTLKAFTKYIKKIIDPFVDTYIIDPAERNPRAKHVYEKAGFKTVAEFTRDDGYFKNIRHFLMIKTMHDTTIRAATSADVPAMVALSDKKRRACEQAQPLFRRRWECLTDNKY